MDENEYKKRFDAVVIKACICHDLGQAALIKNAIATKVPGFTAVCPGPNLAYFSKIATLKEMTDHIYGRTNLLNDTPRPNMFIKELGMYLDYLKKDITKSLEIMNEQKIKYFTEFKNNLLEGIEYYRKLFPQMMEESVEYRTKMLNDLEECNQRLLDMVEEFRSRPFCLAVLIEHPIFKCLGHLKCPFIRSLVLTVNLSAFSLNSWDFSCMPFSANSRTSWVIFMEQKLGPHIEQKWASFAPSAGRVSS